VDRFARVWLRFATTDPNTIDDIIAFCGKERKRFPPKWQKIVHNIHQSAQIPLISGRKTCIRIRESGSYAGSGYFLNQNRALRPGIGCRGPADYSHAGRQVKRISSESQTGV
jgi:hypothetical protein